MNQQQLANCQKISDALVAYVAELHRQAVERVNGPTDPKEVS